jgi:hypothetical protein
MKTYHKPYRLKKKKSILRNRFFWLAIWMIIVIGSLLYFLFFTPFFQIKEIQISGNQKVLTEDIQSRIQWVLAGEGNYSFLCNSNKINQEVLHSFPQIARIDTAIKFPDKLSIKIEERKPAAIFIYSDKYFFIDKEGIIFEETFPNGDEYLKIKNPTLNQGLNLGSKVVEEKLLTSILEIESELKGDFKIPLEEVIIASEQRLNVKTLEGWEIYFNPKGDLDWQLTKLDAILENRIPPEKRRNIGYIDLRFERVYIFPETYNQ